MKYFWDTLLDADLECDVLGWQYISGSLPDGHELDRMDNPQVLLFPYNFALDAAVRNGSCYTRACMFKISI